MQIRKYAKMQILKYLIMQIRNYANTQICKYAQLPVLYKLGDEKEQIYESRNNYKTEDCCHNK